MGEATPLPSLGPLEARVMHVLWAVGEADYLSVRDVRERLGRDLAYTTVMTVLTRLHDKGLLRRRKAGRGWAYTPAVTADGYAAASMRQALQAADDPAAALHLFAAELDPEEAAALRRLLGEGDPR